MSIQHYPKEKLLGFYRQMVLVREFELRAINERRAGLIPGFIHSCVGQEATAVGACAALAPTDVITSTHRGHGHLVAKGGEPKYMMAELAARTTGYCGGKGGSLHISDFYLGILGANGIVAGGIPIAVGAGLAFQQQTRTRSSPENRPVAQVGNLRYAFMRHGDAPGMNNSPENSGAGSHAPQSGGVGAASAAFIGRGAAPGEGSHVALAFFGDGAANEGAFHEALNLAGLWRLPVIFFCENNLYGEGTPQTRQAPVADLAVRAAGYAMPGVIVDGNDVLAVYEATLAAVERARAGIGPTLIEGKTYRQRGHYEGDPMVYRSKAEMEEWKRRDPVIAFRGRLLAEAGATETELIAIEHAIQAALDEAVAFAVSSPKPAPETALEGVYGETYGGLVF